MIRKFNIEIDDKKKNLIIYSGLLMLTFLICLNIIRGGALKANAIKRNIDEISKINRLRMDIETIENKQRQYEEYLYDNISQSAIRTIISNIAKDAGVDIISIKPLARQDIGKIFKEPLELTIRSSYDNLGDFILKIESLKHITKVESFSVKQYLAPGEQAAREMLDREKAELKPVLSASLIISAYSIPVKN
jgi:Tfp pilus assembly protein PilO